MPSRRHSSAMLSSPRKPSSTILIYALLAWHSTIVIAVVLSAFYYVARWMRGLAPGPANKTLEALRILFIYAALEGAAGFLLPRLLPWGGV